MASPVKKSKGKRRRDWRIHCPKNRRLKHNLHPAKSDSLINLQIPSRPLKLATNHLQRKTNETKPKTKKQPQIPPQHITDAPKTPRTPAAAEQLGLDSDVAKQLLKNGEDLSSLTAMIWEAGKMIVEHGIPDTDAKYKSMLAELVKNMVTLPPFFPLSFLNHY